MIREGVRSLMPQRLWRTARNVAARREMLPRKSGTHDEFSPQQLVEHAEQQVREYFDFGGLADDALSGKRMLEVGPGNNLSAAVLLLARGARQVVCIDRFRSRPNPEQSRAAWRILHERMPDEQRRCYADVFDGREPQTGPGPNDRLVYLWDCGIEDSVGRLGAESFDFIVSYSVLEHVLSVDAAIRAMARLLKPGGRMIHRVDLRSHDESRERHPLEFLTWSPQWWRRMTSHTGEPNRVRAGQYRQLLEEHGLTVRRFDVTRRYAIEDVRSIRPRLAAPFRSLSDEELACAGIVFDACKTPRTGEG